MSIIVHNHSLSGQPSTSSQSSEPSSSISSSSIIPFILSSIGRFLSSGASSRSLKTISNLLSYASGKLWFFLLAGTGGGGNTGSTPILLNKLRKKGLLTWVRFLPWLVWVSQDMGLIAQSKDWCWPRSSRAACPHLSWSHIHKSHMNRLYGLDPLSLRRLAWSPSPCPSS